MESLCHQNQRRGMESLCHQSQRSGVGRLWRRPSSERRGRVERAAPTEGLASVGARHRRARLAARWHICEETRNGSAPGRVGFGTLFAPQTIARREGKECLGWLPTPRRRPEAPRTKHLASFRQSILFLLACIRNPRCTKACQSPQPRPPSGPHAGFLHSLGLPSLCRARRGSADESERTSKTMARCRRGVPPRVGHRLESLCHQNQRRGMESLCHQNQQRRRANPPPMNTDEHG